MKGICECGSPYTIYSAILGRYTCLECLTRQVRLMPMAIIKAEPVITCDRCGEEADGKVQLFGKILCKGCMQKAETFFEIFMERCIKRDRT